MNRPHKPTGRTFAPAARAASVEIVTLGAASMVSVSGLVDERFAYALEAGRLSAVKVAFDLRDLRA